MMMCVLGRSDINISIWRYGNCRYSEAADVIYSKIRYLHDGNPAPAGSHTHTQTHTAIDSLSCCLFFFFLSHMKLYNSGNYLDRFPKCRSASASSGSLTVNESFHVRAPSQSCFCAHRTSEALVIFSPPPACLRSARTIPRFVYSCVYLPILILAITRMAGHVRGRFAHSQ